MEPLSKPLAVTEIPNAVNEALATMPLIDVHTHTFDPAFGPLLLWGIDELVTYHYLAAELFRAKRDISYDAYWAMPKTAQADLIWQELFVKRSPISEACRGVLTVLAKLGLNPNTTSLAPLRAWFAAQTPRGYTDLVFKLSGVRKLYMTNDPFDPAERPVWEKGFPRDPRFEGVLRLDSALMNWPAPVPGLKALGYDVEEALSGRTLSEIRRYLSDWCARINARYTAISLPPSFRYPNPDSALTLLMSKCVFPVCRERNIPSAMMIGVKKLVNPHLKLAGDSVGKSEIETVERIALDFQDVRFWITMLARENMHELCIAARKFGNITPFGCWWFLNNPSLIEEITAMRLETLGLSFVPQHSDARVLDQLIYKWDHSRRVIGPVLARKYSDIAATGWNVTASAIQRDVAALLGREVL
jgi:hypothetical protein